MHYKQYKSILSPQNGMNLYHGCTHGCIYCDSRSKCYQMDHEFEDIEVKSNAVAMLDAELRRKRKRGMIKTGAMCDPYMHIEEEIQLTRQCLEVIHHHGFGLSIQTKSSRILRDLDLLLAIHSQARCIVEMTLTTYDEDICRLVEPDVSTTRERVATLEILRDAGIPTVVWLSPILPFINDTRENILGLLSYCQHAKVKAILCFGFGMTLREGNREYYYAKLNQHFPGLRAKYVKRYGNSYSCMCDNSAELMRILHAETAKAGILCGVDEVFAYMRDFSEANGSRQLSLF